jgi:hypothetical protein
MLLKLTYYGTTRPTLVNVKNVESVYQVYDKIGRRYSTKICFKGNESFINVEEDLQTIMKLEQESMEGTFQDTDWETPSIEERLEQSFEQQTYQPRPQRPRYDNRTYGRERNYNSFNQNNY